jgi:hypothetical protein
MISFTTRIWSTSFGSKGKKVKNNHHLQFAKLIVTLQTGEWKLGNEFNLIYWHTCWVHPKKNIFLWMNPTSMSVMCATNFIIGTAFLLVATSFRLFLVPVLWLLMIKRGKCADHLFPYSNNSAMFWTFPMCHSSFADLGARITQYLCLHGDKGLVSG